MDAFSNGNDEERRGTYKAAALILGLDAASIEKDFWVTWVLREMFALEAWGPHFTFKGGTSLAKCWHLIERFSEDVDIVIDRGFLGFHGDALSSRRLERLRDACREQIRGSLLPELRRRFAVGLRRQTWSLDLPTAEEDPDGQTLLFRYPTLFPDGRGYVAPVVKIEFGARSDTEPQESPRIRPTLATAFPGLLVEADIVVRAVAPRRTFWEKTLLLHEETYRPEDKRRKPRMSRHYYDLHRLIEMGVGAAAIADVGLLERIVAHRRVFFRYAWMDYETMQRGRLRLVPLPAQEVAWRKDYEVMGREMFFREPPAFDEVLETVRTFEVEVNRC